MTRARQLTYAVAVTAFALLGACGGDSSVAPKDQGPGPIYTITVTMPATVTEGDTITPAVRAFDSKHTAVPPTGVAVSTTGATVLADGRIIPTGDTTAVSVTVTFTRQSDGAQMQSVARAAVIYRAVRVEILPGQVLTQPGAQFSLRVRAWSRLDSLVLGAPVALLSSAPTVATVGADGQVVAVGVGSAIITAAVHGKTATMPIEVRAPSSDAPYPMTLMFVGGGMTQMYQDAARQAVTRWQKVLRGSAAPALVQLQDSQCGAGSSAVNATTSGVIVMIRADSIDGTGKVAGYGGPCVLRPGYTTPGHYLPAAGIVTLDTADNKDLPRTSDVIAHEIGHVLGIGTGWTVRGIGGVYLVQLNSDPGGPEPRYLGVQGNTVAAQWSFIPSASVGIPIENAMGSGSRDAHWRTTIADLMNPYGGGGLSAFTAASLIDLGYTVDLAGAEPSVPRVKSTLGDNTSFGRYLSPVPLDIGAPLIQPVGIAGPDGTTRLP